MELKEFKNLKEGELITLKDRKGKIIMIIHNDKYTQQSLSRHNYNNENYYYLALSLQPKLENVSKTTETDIIKYHNELEKNWHKRSTQILNLLEELKKTKKQP